MGGSILDSVTGANLTQNVTDVLSSTAFMNLAARFPYNAATAERHDACLYVHRVVVKCSIDSETTNAGPDGVANAAKARKITDATGE